MMEERRLKAKYRGKLAQSVKDDQILKDIEELRKKLPEFCTGCGIQLQSDDPDAPGFYQIPKKILSDHVVHEESEDSDKSGSSQKTRAKFNQKEYFQEDYKHWEEEMEERSDLLAEDEELQDEQEEDDEDLLEFHSYLKEDPIERKYQQQVASFMESIKNADQEQEDIDFGVQFPDEDWQKEQQQDDNKLNVELLCTRCFNLRYHGKIKSEKAESMLPVFDLANVIAEKIRSQSARRHVIVCVVDLQDFDGSLPRHGLRKIIPQETAVDGPGHKFILVANKLDLIPPTANRHRIEQWVARRAQQGGIPQPDSIHLVSAIENKGIKRLLLIIRRFLGYPGDVWIVGAQNSGKSTLVNTLMKQGQAHKYSKDKKEVTTAALPGTTLGIIEVTNHIALPFKCRGFDTPGLVQLHQISSRLNPDEVRMLIPRRTMKPRTYRVCPGYTLLIGGLAKLDIVDSPASTLYVTIWASDEVACHMGRTANSDRTRERHGGVTLIPPLGNITRVHQIGELIPTKVYVEGDRWTCSTHDIHIAGIGWLAIGVKGRGDFVVWAHQGVAITTREALLPDFARNFEKIGWGNKGIKLKETLKKKLRTTRGQQPWLK